MILTTLSSSSKGNIHILENGETTILLDCGVKFERIKQFINDKKIDGVLITHEHGDHIGGCKSLSENKSIGLYSANETLDKVNVPNFIKNAIEPFKQFKIGTFKIIAFEVSHDAIHPVNYLIYDEKTGAQLLYITDTGNVDGLNFRDIDYFLIECNFDEKWFNKEELTITEQIKKKRLLGNKGHLSINQTIEFLKRTINCNTKKIILCHISNGFKEYVEFENKVRDELNFKDVVALNPNYIGPVINNLKEEKIGVIPFD